MALDADTRAFLEKANATPATPPDSVPLEAFRAVADALKPLGWDREDLEEVRDLSVPTPRSSETRVRLYRPISDCAPALMIAVHGGSWVRVTVEHMDEYYRVLANRTGCALAAVDYELAPESKFPEAIETVHATARWLQEAAAELGCDQARLAIFGESSGGNLAAAATLLARERGDVRYSHQILLLPMLDARFGSASWDQLGHGYMVEREQLEWALQLYAPGVRRTDPLLSPLCATDLKGLPPALVITAEYDPLRDDGERYVLALESAGVPARHWRVPGLIHPAILVPRAIPSVRRFMDDLGVAIRELLATSDRALVEG